MKNNIILVLLAGVAFTTACSKPSGTDLAPYADVKTLDDKWPAYKEDVLSGKILNEDWSAVTAAVRVVENNDKELFLDIYGEVVADACVPQFNLKKPFITMIIPANFKLTEYVSDLSGLSSNQNGNPVSFISYQGSRETLISDRSKLQIVEMTNMGFEAKMFATVKDKDGVTSVVNGKISVQDCRKKADFKVWKNLVSSYKLQSFDGQQNDSEIAFVEMDYSNFYDRTKKKYLNAVVLPLYFSVSGNSSRHYNFGPIEGLGTSEIIGNTMKYNYQGPLTFKNTDITISLSITIEKIGDQLQVQYTLEIPNHISKTTHQFVLKKSR